MTPHRIHFGRPMLAAQNYAATGNVAILAALSPLHRADRSPRPDGFGRRTNLKPDGHATRVQPPRCVRPAPVWPTACRRTLFADFEIDDVCLDLPFALE